MFHVAWHNKAMSKREEPFDRPLDDRAEAYTKSGDIIASIARRHNHIDIDETTHARWRQLMGLMREVDTWADDTDATHQDVLDGLADFDTFSSRYPDLAPESLDNLARGAVLWRTARILKLGERAAQTTSAHRFVAFRILEAREAVNLFADTSTAHVSEQPGFDDEFMPTGRALGEAATLWDSIVDGPKDKRTGKQVVATNFEYYARLATAMIQRAKVGGRAALHIEPNLHLLSKLGKRFTNRLKNGVPEYSNLRIFGRK
jgi:hypothetical protein